ncbi:GntR family transcriptional regulator [Yoonia sp. R2331]|uniref:GntR family transcriptional regulator n=1 Tax=Yoonia sp. R2331 TaxID=3237238 RepID=UPI0034E3A74E
MKTQTFRDWRSVQTEVRRRIHAREWKPGDLIPNEADLAQEFGCARTTVNRALRAVAESGLLDRRRKAGTRVAAQPVAMAKLNIAVIRKEVEARGQKYGYRRISSKEAVPPKPIQETFNSGEARSLLHFTALHLADGAPYAFEDRWIDPQVVPNVSNESFETVSANEWLLRNTPYTHGEIVFSAATATEDSAALLHCPDQSALFAIERVTWDRENAVTQVRLLFAPGHEIRTAL